MISAKDLFLEEREAEMYEYEYKVTPTTIKEYIPILNQIKEDIKRLQAEEKELFEKMIRIGHAFENPDNLPEGVIAKMVDGVYPYIYAWSVGTRLNVKPSYWYEGEENCYRNPFYNWESEVGIILKRKEKKYYEND